MVCGHTKCGGANAALSDDDLGEILNTWLHPVRELRKKHQSHLDDISCSDARANRLAELNVYNSLETLKKNRTVAKAMVERGLTLHGVIYDIPAGELRVLDEVKETHSPMVLEEAKETHSPMISEETKETHTSLTVVHNR
jgi:carbonic anhydrase